MLAATVEFWKVQNTGYSAGVSWFDSGGTALQPARFNSEKEARQFLVGHRWGGADVRWRLVHVVMVTTDRERVTTERFYPVRSQQRAKFT